MRAVLFLRQKQQPLPIRSTPVIDAVFQSLVVDVLVGRAALIAHFVRPTNILQLVRINLGFIVFRQ